MGTPLWPMQFFDPKTDFTIVHRRLPHWCQAGTLCFITWRTCDTIPKPILRRWHADRDAWLRRHGIDPKRPDWKDRLQELDRSLRGEFVRTFSERWHRQLDSGHGACVLREPSLAEIVANSLHKFDGERYELTDFVVRPNHVHLLAAFVDEDGMLNQCKSWKHFTAREINAQIKSRDHFWQQDGFDHLVRTEEQFQMLRRYIAQNPEKACLPAGEFVHYGRNRSSAPHSGRLGGDAIGQRS
jgi:putative transposase